MAAVELAGAFGGLSEALEAFLLEKQRRADREEEAAFRQQQLDLQTRQVDIGEAGQQAEIEAGLRRETVSGAERLRRFLGPGAHPTEEQAGTLEAGGIPVNRAEIVGPTRPGRDLGSRLTLPADFFEIQAQEERGLAAVGRREESEERRQRMADAAFTRERRDPRTEQQIAQQEQEDALARINAQALAQKGPQPSPEEEEDIQTFERLMDLLDSAVTDRDVDAIENIKGLIARFLSDNPDFEGLFESPTEPDLFGPGEPVAEPVAGGGGGLDDVLNRLTSALGITTAQPTRRPVPAGRSPGGRGGQVPELSPEMQERFRKFFEPGFVPR